MRVLLDENLPRRLMRDLGEGVSAMTVQERGWAGTRNGELLRIAQEEFDVLLTTDKGIPHQQNLSAFSIAVVLLEARSNRFEHLSALIPNIRKVLQNIQPGTLTRISV